MHKGVELHEGHGEHGSDPLTLRVSVTIAILAVLVAAITLLGHRTTTEELLLQAQATDQWAYYQAKNIRAHEMQGYADLLAVLAPQDKEKAAEAREKYLKEVERYGNDKDEIGDKARELEKERDVMSRRGDRFDGGEVLLEIALVVCSITLLTKRTVFWYSGIFLGLLGVIVALTGFAVH